MPAADHMAQIALIMGRKAQGAWRAALCLTPYAFGRFEYHPESITKM